MLTKKHSGQEGKKQFCNYSTISLIRTLNGPPKLFELRRFELGGFKYKEKIAIGE